MLSWPKNTMHSKWWLKNGIFIYVHTLCASSLSYWIADPLSPNAVFMYQSSEGSTTAAAVPSQHILTQFMRYQRELLAKSKKVFNMHQQLLYVKASSLWHKHAVGYRMPVSLLLMDLDPGQCSPLGTTIVGKRHLFSISRATESHYIQNIWNSRKKPKNI